MAPGAIDSSPQRTGLVVRWTAAAEDAHRMAQAFQGLHSPCRHAGLFGAGRSNPVAALAPSTISVIQLTSSMP